MLRVYITDLTAYNKGYLIGNWIDIPTSNLDAQIQKILSSGQSFCYFELGYTEDHEEYFITDYEWNDISLFEIDEYHNIHKLNESLQLIENHRTIDLKIIKFLLDNYFADSVEIAINMMDEVIIYENQTMVDIAYDFINENYSHKEMPELLRNYIDYEKFAKDLELDGRFYKIENDIFEYIG